MSFSSVDDAGADEGGAGLQAVLLDLLAEVVPLHAVLQDGGAVELVPLAEVVAAAGAVVCCSSPLNMDMPPFMKKMTPATIAAITIIATIIKITSGLLDCF